jgi:hypothetical protein
MCPSPGRLLGEGQVTFKVLDQENWDLNWGRRRRPVGARSALLFRSLLAKQGASLFD